MLNLLQATPCLRCPPNVHLPHLPQTGRALWPSSGDPTTALVCTKPNWQLCNSLLLPLALCELWLWQPRLLQFYNHLLVTLNQLFRLPLLHLQLLY